MRLVAVIVAMLICGCASSTHAAPALPFAAGPRAPHADATAGNRSQALAGAEFLPQSFGAPVALDPTGGTRNGGSEPNIRAATNGRVFVTSTNVHLWRSENGGQTFTAMGNATCDQPHVSPLPSTCAPGNEDRDAGLQGPSDAALDTLANGTLLWAGLFATVTPGSASVPFQRSFDDGEHWTHPIDLAEGDTADRPWISTGTHNEVYATWGDYGPPDNGGFANAPVTLFRASHDGGSSWDKAVKVTSDSVTGKGPIVVDKTSGVLYIPVAGRTVDVFRSTDGGRTWETKRLPAREITAQEPGVAGQERAGFAVGAVDGAGTLYVAWADDEGARNDIDPVAQKETLVTRVYISVSHDRGDSWTRPLQLSDSTGPAVLPAIVAGARGKVAVAWYQGSMSLPGEQTRQDWRVFVAQSPTADQDHARWTLAPATQSPIHVGSVCTGGFYCSGPGRSLGDFLDIELRPDGMLMLAFAGDPPTASPTEPQAIILVAVATGGTTFRS